MDPNKHPNRVTCPKCGQFGTKLPRMISCRKPNCGKCPHGPYWYVNHRVGSRIRQCYIGKNEPQAIVASISQ